MVLLNNICGESCSVTDEEVNQAYNYLMSENLYRTKHVYASTRRNFLPRKTTKKAEWAKFVHLVQLCKTYKYNLREYIKFSLWHVLYHKNGNGWQDPSKLCTLKCLEAFSREKANIERRSNCYKHIFKSTMRICEICTALNIRTFGAFMKWSMKNGRLSEMIYVGTVSRYIIAMIPDIEKLAVNFDQTLRSTVQEMVLDDLCNLRSMAVDAIAEYDRANAGKGIFAIINGALAKSFAKLQKPTCTS